MEQKPTNKSWMPVSVLVKAYSLLNSRRGFVIFEVLLRATEGVLKLKFLIGYLFKPEMMILLRKCVAYYVQHAVVAVTQLIKSFLKPFG